MLFRSVIWMFLFLNTARLAGQIPQFRQELINEVKGTPLLSLGDMAQDDRGFIWIGGLYSLCKYDGTDMEVFTNRPDDTTSIAPGPYVLVIKGKNECMWVGSNTNGLIRFDLRTEKARNFISDPAKPSALTGNEIAGLYETPEGGLWVGTNKLALHYLPPGASEFQRFRPPLPPGVADYSEAGLIGEIVPDPTNPDWLWLGSRNGVYRFDCNTHEFRLFPFATSVNYWYRSYNIQLYLDASGQVWAGSFSTGLMRLNQATGQWQVWKKTNDKSALINANTVFDIVPFDDHQLLVSTAIDGIWLADFKTGTVEYTDIAPKQPNGLPANLFFARQAANGDFWFGTGNGLVRLTHKTPALNWRYFPNLNPQLRRNNWQRAYALSPDKSLLCMGTLRGDGLLLYDWRNKHLEAIPYRKPLKHDETDVLMDALVFDPSGRLWIGTEDGLLCMQQPVESALQNHAVMEPVNPITPVLGNAHVTALLVASETLWIGTKGRGLFRMHLGTRVQEAVKPGAGLSGNSNINCLLADAAGQIWVGHDGGLTVLNGKTEPKGYFQHASGARSGLSWSQVTDLELDGAGHLWIATLGGGLNRLRHADPDHPQFDHFFNNDVPGGNVVYEFVLAENGQLWLGTQSGHALLDTATRQFVNYDHRDGLFAKIGAMIRLPDGYIVSGGNAGFHIFHPDSLRKSDTQPVVYFKRFKVFDQEIDLPSQIDRLPALTLDFDQNYFSFELGALNFGEKERTQFAYWLEGFDPGWVSSGSRDYVSYTNLPAGKYRFRVKAANKHGVWSAQEKVIEIVILPPWWRSWWFRLLAVMVLAGFAWALYKAWQQRRRVLEAQRVVEYFNKADYRNASVHDILWDVIHNCIARLQLEDCVIYLLDESGENLVQEAASGAKNPRPFEILNPIIIPLGKGIVGAVALKKQAELISDTRLDPRYIVDDQPRLSELAVPIVHENRVIGVIDSEHSRKGFFKKFHLKVLQTVAALSAEKIVKARAEAIVKEKERQLHELNRNLAESQLTALRAQMNPHFLFNCLNSINWYIVKNQPKEASRYLTKFSRLIRLILEYSKNREITLSQELDTLRLYIEMEAMRFEHHFEFDISIAPDLDPEDIAIPPLILQPYVENAIWHGLMQKNGPGKLCVEIFSEKNLLVCVIEDDGIGREAAAEIKGQAVRPRELHGMNITEARLAMLKGKSSAITPVHIHDLLDASGHAAGTRVEIRLPI